ncbi:hypothetical protein BW13_07015 [Bifidobacterium sp. UTCIF-37]|nr:hypothetical protein BW13_07015 [Bifidobacterium sp. UTCIF-37]TPF88558.1 hypothetical protein BW11_07260 [Bifidobacterium sp. UTCIF-38]
MLLVAVLAGIIAYPRVTGVAGGAADDPGRSQITSSTTKHTTDGDMTGTGDGTDKAETAAPDPDAARIDAVRQTIESTVAQYPGDWSVYALDLGSGRDTAINDKPLVAASLIKLYIMLTVFDRLEHGAIADNATIDANLKQMITVSSNDAANRLLAVIGGKGGTTAAIATVTDTAVRYGFSSTKELRALTGAASGNDVENWTSARDCGTFLAKAYRGELVSANASKRMVDLLLGQTRRTKIPAGVPAGVQVANKTGELAAVQNDVAIVYGAHPYVIAVMTNDVDESAATNITTLSANVYQAFEGRDSRGWRTDATSADQPSEIGDADDLTVAGRKGLVSPVDHETVVHGQTEIRCEILENLERFRIER